MIKSSKEKQQTNMNKTIFIRTTQPLALEVLGYVLCVITAFTIIMHNTHAWESYVYAAIAVGAVGAIYRMIIAHSDMIIRILKRMYDGITIFLCRLAGKRGLILDREKTRYAVIGMSLFIPAIMSFYTFPYLLQTSFGMNFANSYLFTIAIAFIIFLVDRVFVATMGWKKIWYGVLARLILAFALGLFLSKPIELQIFEKETTEELKVQKQEKITAIEKERQEAFARIDAKEADAMKEVNRARQEYEKEVNFGYGPRTSGHGPEAQKKLEYFQEQDNLYRNNVAPAIAKERATVDSLFNAKSIEYQKTQSYGYGARSAALAAAEDKYPAIAFNAWLIVITLIMLDISPLLAKLLMPKSQSDRTEQMEEEEKEHAVQVKRAGYKAELMMAELERALVLIEKLNLNKEEKERAQDIVRRKITRNYVGEEVFSRN